MIEDLIRELRAAGMQVQRAGPDNLRAASLVLAAIAERAADELERLERLENGEQWGERVR